MNDEKNLQELILTYERALLDLKTSYNIAPSVNTNVVKYSGVSTTYFYINYDNGKEDIVTNVYSSQNAILGPISGNSQKVMFSQAITDADIISTRKILNVML